MRLVSAMAVAALLGFSALPAAADPPAPVDEQATAGGACTRWDDGQAARHHGWKLSPMNEADKAALIEHYNRVVAPRADVNTDDVIVARHPDWSVLRVVIVHHHCIVDMAQMGRGELQKILEEARTPI